ncbi:YdiU family protein [bacterium]|nr:YdiU family protein [bacterium]
MHLWDSKQIPILQLGNDFYDPVKPAHFPKQILRYWNHNIDVTGISKEHFVIFNSIPNNIPQPLALRYHGHQFQHYNPDLGDGRGFLFAQINIKNQWYDFGTKGSGQTPYSRQGDGRLTLKGAYRESLATEMLESLGVNTSRTLCFYETGENLERNDEPSPTRSAVLTRFTLGHIRIGSFQRLAYFGQLDNLKKLTSYSMNFYYADEYAKIDPTDENLLASRFLQCVVDRNAKLVAQVMMAGFIHGVLNTDNINISGELFDYGPYRFMPAYDPQFTAAYFDQQGLYCFGRQPSAFLWNLHQLAGCLKMAYPQLPAEEILSQFSDLFNTYVQEAFFKRLNLKPSDVETNSSFLTSYFSFMEQSKLNFEEMFFDFHSKRVLEKNSAKYEKATELLKQLQKFEVANVTLANHVYLKEEKPCTLLIDEIENIWKPIAEHDDWSLYNQKLQSIRKFRGLY